MGAMDGGKTYVKEEQMLELLTAFNLAMQEVAMQQRAVFVDVRSLIGNEQGIFYDGVHLNEKGARHLARALADRLGPILLEHDRRAAESRRATPASANK